MHVFDTDRETQNSDPMNVKFDRQDEYMVIEVWYEGHLFFFLLPGAPSGSRVPVIRNLPSLGFKTRCKAAYKLFKCSDQNSQDLFLFY